MSGSLTRRLERLEQHLPGPERPWRADDYHRWRHQHITAGDPDGLIAQAQARVRAWEARFDLREEAGNHARTVALARALPSLLSRLVWLWAVLGGFGPSWWQRIGYSGNAALMPHVEVLAGFGRQLQNRQLPILHIF